MEKEINMLFEYESKHAEFEDITMMLWYVLEDYYVGFGKADLYTKANNYDRLNCYLSNIHILLLDRCEKMKSIIDKAYDIKRSESNVNKGDCEKQKV